MKEILTMDLKGKLLIAVVFMVLGFMLSVQYKATERQRSVRMDRVEDLSERLRSMESENKQLQLELETLRAGAVSYTHLTLPTIYPKCRSRWSPYH